MKGIDLSVDKSSKEINSYVEVSFNNKRLFLTKDIKKTSNPVWNHIEYIDLWYDIEEKNELVFNLLNKGKDKNYQIG